MKLVEPKVKPPLDESFRPAVLANRAYLQDTKAQGVPLVIGLQRGEEFTRFETKACASNLKDSMEYAERIVKFLLWQRGGHTVYVGGPREIGENIQKMYSADGSQKFDFHFMGRQVYEKEFRIIVCSADEVPASRETGKLLGRNLSGCRIGFDLGASDRKVSAVVDGNPVYSEEVIWEPRKNTDPNYHYREVMTALKTAANKLPRVDAIGGSSAGIYVDNRPMVAGHYINELHTMRHCSWHHTFAHVLASECLRRSHYRLVAIKMA